MTDLSCLGKKSSVICAWLKTLKILNLPIFYNLKDNTEEMSALSLKMFLLTLSSIMLLDLDMGSIECNEIDVFIFLGMPIFSRS
jgi:hypothetical protein